MKIRNINGTRYVWQHFASYRTTPTRNVEIYCADGDGFIEVRTCNGVIGLYDQNVRVRSFKHTNITNALRDAELYADAFYPTMLEAYLINP